MIFHSYVSLPKGTRNILGTEEISAELSWDIFWVGPSQDANRVLVEIPTENGGNHEL